LDTECPQGFHGTGASAAKTVEKEKQKQVENSSAALFPFNLEFRTANMLISEVEEHRKSPFDVVLCMKLTKWVHLNWGDDGLKVLFHKCFRLLKPGGTLVLEAQDWSSYRDVKHWTPHMRENKNQISLRPQEFVAYLVGVVGFQKPETVADPSQLKRPLLLFVRPLLHSNRGSAPAATSSVTEGGGVPATGPKPGATEGQPAPIAQMAEPTELARATVHKTTPTSTSPDASLVATQSDLPVTVAAATAAAATESPSASLTGSSASGEMLAMTQPGACPAVAAGALQGMQPAQASTGGPRPLAATLISSPSATGDVAAVSGVLPKPPSAASTSPSAALDVERKRAFPGSESSEMRQ